MNEKHEKSALGGFAPAARASPIAIVLYDLFGYYLSHCAPSPWGTGGTSGGKSSNLTGFSPSRKNKVITSLGADFDNHQ
jgi:hypothetical protein